MENGRIIMGLWSATVFHYAPCQYPKWLFTDTCLQNDRPKIIDLDSPLRIVLEEIKLTIGH